MVNRLDDLASSNISAAPVGRPFKCTFCEADDHGYKECEVKEVCIRCGLDNHRSEKCFWMSNSCSWCSTAGHASKLHQTKDQGFRLKVMNEYGPELFAHFWADQQQDMQEQVPWSLRLQSKEIRRRLVVRIKGSRGRAREQVQEEVLITDKAGSLEVKSQNPMLDFRLTHGLEATVALEVTESSRDKCSEQSYLSSIIILLK